MLEMPDTPGGEMRDQTAQRSAAELMGKLALSEGSQTSPIEGVTLLRISRFLPRMPVLYEPCAAFILQGEKTGFLGAQSFEYKAGQYLLLPVPLPFECETRATPDSPLLALYVRLRPEMIATLLAGFQDEHVSTLSPPRTFEGIPLCGPLADTVLRLLEAMASPDEAMALGTSLVRELHFRLLKSENGDRLRSALGFDGHFSQITRALHIIHRSYTKPLNVPHLARQAGLSQSVFHLHFRELTSTSPVQYLKAIRLHKARSLMLDEGIGSAEAAGRVGYVSASQFGREYKRLFGHSPLNDLAKIRSEPML